MQKIYQRTMTICVASIFWGNLGHGHRLFLSRSKFSEDHDHMCQKAFLRESWSWSSSFSFPFQSVRRSVFYYCRSEFAPRSEFTIRSVFSTGGSFGSGWHLCMASPIFFCQQSARPYSILSFCTVELKNDYVQFSKTSPAKSGESSKNPVEKIASNLVTSMAVMVFFGPETRIAVELNDYYVLGLLFARYIP